MNLFVILILQFILKIASGTQFNLFDYESELSYSAAEIITATIKDHIQSLRIITILDSYDQKKGIELLDFLDNIFLYLNYPIAVSIENANFSYILDYEKFPRNKVLVIADNVSGVMKLLDANDFKIFDYSGNYVFIIQLRPNDMEIYSFFVRCFKLFIMKVLLIINDENGVQILSYAPYSNQRCNYLEIIEINSFQNDSFSRNIENYFMEKAFNFHKCPLKIATRHDPPFIEILNKSYELSGIEGSLMSLFAEKLNFTMQIVIPDGNAKLSQISAIQMIIDGSADLTIGGIAANNLSSQHLTYSDMIFQYHLMIAIPPIKGLNPIDMLLFPFSKNIWIILGSIFSFTFFLITILTLRNEKFLRNFIIGKRVQHPNLNAISMFFGNGVPKTPDNNFARTLFMFWMLLCLVLRTCYIGELYHLIRNKNLKKSFDSYADIEQKKAKIYATESLYELYDDYEDEQKKYTLTNDSVEELLTKISRTDFDGAALISSPRMMYFNRNRTNKAIIVLDNANIPFSSIIYFQKDSYLTLGFNRIISLANAHGFNDKFLTKYSDRLAQRYRQMISKEPKILNVTQIYGILEVLVIGWAISIFIFLMELLKKSDLYQNCSHLRRRIKF